MMAQETAALRALKHLMKRNAGKLSFGARVRISGLKPIAITVSKLK